MIFVREFGVQLLTSGRVLRSSNETKSGFRRIRPRIFSRTRLFSSVVSFSGSCTLHSSGGFNLLTRLITVYKIDTAESSRYDPAILGHDQLHYK